MIEFDVSTPELGEPTTLDSSTVMLGEPESVRVVISSDGEAVCAFQVPAEEAMLLSRALYSCAVQAKPATSAFQGLRRLFGSSK